MRFEKWHAHGNSYLLVERDDERRLDAARVRRLCDVATGIGSDGLLEVFGRRPGGTNVVIWNPDGGTSEMSGNGTRIAAASLLEQESGPVEVDTGSRVVDARAKGRTSAGVMLVEQQLGRIDVGSDEELELADERLVVATVNLGNPHAVVRREQLSREELLRLGPALERHARFPERTNVQLVRPESGNVVRALVWERGAGETASSGSSATAVAALAVARGWCESPVRVAMPGGELTVSVGSGRATLTGPAERICVGETTL